MRADITTTDWRATASEVALAACALAARGWAPATAGNFSARIDERHAAITVSGRDKGKLTEHDFLLVDLDGQVIDGQGKPSAETPLHLQLYRHKPSIRAVLHTHSPNQTVAGRVLAHEGSIRFEGYELLKAFAGVGTHEASVELPVFANTQDMEALVQIVDARLRGDERLFGYLIEGHGIYAWGTDLADALRHLEAFDFLLGCEMELRRFNR
ncbi:MAG: methylthioribulose 1-phosphate dehydratase [Burkholderiaceae bacterium]